LSLSVGLRPGDAIHPRDREVPGGGTSTPDAASAATQRHADPAGLRRLTLRFLDEGLERAYQRQGGAESQTAFRMTITAAAWLWLVAAVVTPAGTAIPMDHVVPLCAAMALLNWSALLFSVGADTLDRQHLVVSVLTSANGLAILWLASTGGVLPGYGISAIMLLLVFGFVARTGFIFAAGRSLVIVVGFVTAAWLYRDRGSLEVDGFIFGAAVIGTLLALRRLEQSRRRVFFQDVVITQQANALQVEKDRADVLLRNVLPESISSRLLVGERTIADAYPNVTVLFADIVGFTSLAARLPAEDVVRMLDRLFARFDELVAERGLEKIKTIGDAYMAAGGLTKPLDDHALRVVDLGLAMIDAAAHDAESLSDLQLRIGVHSGPVVGGVIGHDKFAFDIWGETVNIASRLESHGIAGRLQVSDTTWRSVEGAFEGELRGPIRVRGYGLMETHLVVRRRDDGRL
jgi:class 3 adenylate cyclase